MNGKCRRLWQKYWGKLEDIVKAVEGGPPPAYAEIFQFGLPTALWQEVERQKIVEEIDKLCPKREQSLSIGESVAIAAINRAIGPVSKQGMGEWFTQTTLRRFLPAATANALSSPRFGDHLDAVPEATAKARWQKIIGATLFRETIDLSQISYDGTNFYTFMSTFNVKSQLARRGKNKQGRNNLRQVSYALFCSRDGLPLFYDVDEGNGNDAREFPGMIDRFADFLQTLPAARASRAKPEVTTIFDKGNNSAHNIALWDRHGFPFVGSVKWDEHQELTAISNQDPRFLPCQKSGLETIETWAVKKGVYGRERSVVVTFNQNLFNGQLQTVTNDIDKALTGLAALQQRLDDRAKGVIKGGQAPPESSIASQCRQLLKRPFLDQLIRTEITPGRSLNYQVDSDALAQLAATYWGKNIPIATRDTWSHEEVVEAYHRQYVIEHVFRSMKDRLTGSWRPLFHWTDQKIHLHGFYCTIAVLLRALIHRRLKRVGIDLSLSRRLKALDGIKEAIVIYPRTGRKKKEKQHTVLTKMTELQQQLVKILGLKQQTNAG